MVEWINNTNLLKDNLIQTIINVSLVILIAVITSKILKKYIVKYYVKNQRFVLRLKNIAVYTLAIYGILNQFTAFSDIIKALAASTGVITLALGLAAQDANRLCY